MEPMKIEIVTDGGPWAEHNYPCPVFSDRKAVYSLTEGIFYPSWEAQSNGWHLVKADSFLKILIIKWLINR